MAPKDLDSLPDNLRRITKNTRSPCPRCGEPMPPYPGAISRLDGKTEICSGCGAAEAIADSRRPGSAAPPRRQIPGGAKKNSPATRALTIDVDTETARCLKLLDAGNNPDEPTAEGALLHLAYSAAAGVCRPGAWEHAWVASAFSLDHVDGGLED